MKENISIDYHHSRNLNKVVQAKAYDFMGLLPKESCDLIIVDPPYPISTNNGTNRFSEKGWFKGSQDDYEDGWYNEYKSILYRQLDVLKSGRHIYTFVDEKNLFKLKPIIDDYFEFKKVIVWHKGMMGLGYHYRNIIEYVLLHSKGKSQMQITKSPNFYRSDKPRHSIHPTPKPVNLYRWLMRNSSFNGDTVLDCFAGSGTVGIASLKENRNFLACEIEEKFVKYANQRIDKEKNQGKLF